jgi:glycosyltransferase involved in cell wall biosynthesis
MKNNKLPLSIVIPCADDVRIKHCLDSIDENVEVVVVLNGNTKEVANIVNNYDVKIIRIKEKNLSKALNIGIKNSSNSNIILIDSDCRFEKGAIKKLFKGLRNHYIAKGKVIFESNNFLSRTIANVRDYIYHNPPKPYNPFMAIKKNIKQFIDNYYFDESIHWTEDADLNTRLKKAGIEVNYVFSARVFHSPLSLKHDLRSAFRYGIGKRIRVEKKTSDGIGVHFEKIHDVLLKKGVFSGIYYFVWNISYIFGYIYQTVFDPYRTRVENNR